MGKVLAAYLLIGAVIALTRQIYAYVGLTRKKFHPRIDRVMNNSKIVKLRLLDIFGDVLLWPLTVCITIYVCTHIKAQHNILEGLEMVADEDEQE